MRGSDNPFSKIDGFLVNAPFRLYPYVLLVGFCEGIFQGKSREVTTT